MSKPKEEWKWIKGYEGLYQISSYGRLKSYHKKEKGFVLSNVNQNGWYFTVNLRDGDGKSETMRIHRLVASTFIGDIPDGYHVHHKDGDKQNNCVDNLEIIEAHKHLSYEVKNNPDIYKNMNFRNMYEHPKTIYMYTKDGEYLASFPNSNTASIVTGVCQRNILQVASKDEFLPGRIRKQAGGYVWSFEPPDFNKMKEGDKKCS